MSFIRGLFNRLGDIKTRTLLLVVAVLVLVVVGIVFTSMRQQTVPDVTGDVRTGNIGDIASLPGVGEYDEAYAELQLQENLRLAEQAQGSGDAAIPRLINQPGADSATLGFGVEYCEECVYGADGYDQNGYDAKGFDRDGYDRDGYDANGFDRDGYNRDGYDANGFDRDGYDRDGYDADGYDRNGCDRDGYDRDGNYCYDLDGYNEEGYDRFGYDRDGYDKDGFDRDGYDRDGYDTNGCNREGYDRDGNYCYDEGGFDVFGYDDEGFDRNGFDRQGYDREGYDADGYDRSGFDRNGCNRDGVDRNGLPCNGLSLPGTRAASTDDAQEAYRRLLEEQQALRDAQLSAEQEARDRERYLAEQEAMQQAFEALLQTQSTSVVATWGTPTQMYVRGIPPVEETTGVSGDGSDIDSGPVLYKAGDIVFATLDTSLNSDEPGPVLATIIQGPLKGSKVIGELERQEKKLALTFSLLSSPDLPNSIPMEAVAIDAQTARTALASDVNNHYMLRYGTLFASAFLEGVGDAILTGISQPELEVVDGVVVSESVDVTATEAVLVGIGTVGKRLGEELNVFDKPPTVTLDSGTGIGLLFMQDFTVNGSSAAQTLLTEVDLDENDLDETR